MTSGFVIWTWCTGVGPQLPSSKHARIRDPCPLRRFVAPRIYNPSTLLLPRLNLTRCHAASMFALASACAGCAVSPWGLHAAPSALSHAPLRARPHLAVPRCALGSWASDVRHVRATWPAPLLRARPCCPVLWSLLTSRSGSSPSPFQAQGETFTVAQPPDLRHLAMIARTSRQHI